MRIMTFNMRADNVLDIRNRWKKRADIVYSMIEKYNCDIIGIQEATNKMLDDLSENLPNHRIVGTTRTKKVFAEGNNLIIPTKHKILSHSTFWLSKSPEKEGSTVWYSLFPRICTTAIVKIYHDIPVRIYNTHLDCLLPKARDYGLKIIGEHIQTYYEKEKLPVILMGDFNATPNSTIIQNVVNGIYSKKKFIAVQDHNKALYEQTTMSMFKGNKTGIHIDYIFVSEEFNIISTEIGDYHKDDKYPSDHYPIIAEVNLNVEML